MDWVAFGKEFGWPILILIGLSIGVWRFATLFAWPLVMRVYDDLLKRIDEYRLSMLAGDVKRDEERDMFLANLKLVSDANMANSKDIIKAINENTKAIKALYRRIDK